MLFQLSTQNKYFPSNCANNSFTDLYAHIKNGVGNYIFLKKLQGFRISLSMFVQVFVRACLCFMECLRNG